MCHSLTWWEVSWIPFPHTMEAFRVCDLELSWVHTKACLSNIHFWNTQGSFWRIPKIIDQHVFLKHPESFTLIGDRSHSALRKAPMADDALLNCWLFLPLMFTSMGLTNQHNSCWKAFGKKNCMSAEYYNTSTFFLLLLPNKKSVHVRMILSMYWVLYCRDD